MGEQKKKVYELLEKITGVKSLYWEVFFNENTVYIGHEDNVCVEQT